MERIPASIEEVPLLAPTLRIMKFWGLVLDHNYRRYLALVPYIVVNITEFFDLYFSKDPVVTIVRNVYITVLFLDTHLRGLLVVWRRYEYERFMEYLRELYVELLLSKDEVILKELARTNKIVNIFAKINLLMGTMSVCGFLTQPFLSGQKMLPFGIYIPGIDKYASPYYEILFVIQFGMTSPGVSMFITFTNLFVAFIFFAILMCKRLQRKLRALNDSPKHLVHEEIISCIQYQLKLVRFVDTMNKLATYLHLLEYLLCGAMLCVMLFLFLIVNTTAQRIIICAFLIMTFSQNSIIYYFANELYDQSLEIAVAAYDCRWFEFDVESQKLLKLLLLRAQKPCSVLVGNIYPMNLQLLQSLLNVTYSYFTLLKRVYD